MPGPLDKYPLYPQFGTDPVKHENTISLAFEVDLFTAGSTVNFQLKTGSSEIRLYDQLVEFYNSSVDFTILEGATVANGVTPVIPGNSDRNSTFVSSVFASSDPTGISGGVPLKTLEHFGINSAISGFGDIPPQQENYTSLKYNTDYIFRFVNVGTEDIIDFRFILLYAE